MGGYIDLTIIAFREMPYAQSPIGRLRFEQPKAIETPSAKIIDATKSGSACVQYRYNSAYPVEMIEGEDEDCLAVDVYLPVRKLARKSQHNL